MCLHFNLIGTTLGYLANLSIQLLSLLNTSLYNLHYFMVLQLQATPELPFHMPTCRNTLLLDDGEKGALTAV